MLDTKRFEELQLVELLQDLPEYGLNKGEIGVVVEVFDTPSEAYDLEFVEESGRSSKFAYSVRPTQIRSVSEVGKEGLDKRGSTTAAKAALNDVVEVIEDLPEYGVKRGELGTVVEVLDDPSEAYILEFVDDDGSSRLAYCIRPEQILNTAQEVFERGLALLNAGRSADAVREFRRAVKIQPNYVKILHNSIVRSFGHSGDWQRKITAMRLVLRVDPGHQTARDNLAIAFMNHGVEKASEGDLESCLDLFHLGLSAGPSAEIAIELQRNVAAAYTSLGIRAHAAADLDKAHVCLRYACAYHPNDQTRHNLALSCSSVASWLIGQGRTDEAIEGFERALDGGLATPWLFNDYAVALTKVSRVNDAILALEMALEIEPDNDTLRQNLVSIRRATSKAILETAEAERPFVFMPPPAMSDRAFVAA